MKYLMLILLVFEISIASAQDDLLSLTESKEQEKEHVTGAFKSSRVINGHSIEFIGKKVLDVRILHRFGIIKNGISELFGLDEASMRLGFDYGISNNLTIGIGRSTLNKELDGFLKYRLIQQSEGKNPMPISVVVIGGTTLFTTKFQPDAKHAELKHRVAYFTELLIGRKFSEAFSFQVSPVYIHRNLVPYISDNNDSYALGLGMRLKLSRRVAAVADYHIVFSGLNKDLYHNPFSIGFDIETGGHVFQLHFSNTTGMNEKAFITQTSQGWNNGEIRFGFNLSRVFLLGSEKK